MKKIYLDYAATTPVDLAVLAAMQPYFAEKYGNAGSLHGLGQEAIAAIDKARGVIAKVIDAEFDEIIFTGSATEANNLAIFGVAEKSNLSTLSSFTSDRKQMKTMDESSAKLHFISTNIEHESVIEPLKELQKIGHEITYLKVNKDGFISVSDLEKNIKNNTILISIIYANNEIGTIQPVKEIGKLIEKKAAYVCSCSSDDFEKFVEKKTNCPCRNLSVEEQLVLSDIYCRAGYFSRAFAIVKNKYRVKPSASYRVLKSIIKHTKNEKLIEKCKRFIEDTELHISGFSAELVDVLNDEIDRFIDKTKITKHKDIWL